MQSNEQGKHWHTAQSEIIPQNGCFAECAQLRTCFKMFISNFFCAHRKGLWKRSRLQIPDRWKHETICVSKTCVVWVWTDHFPLRGFKGFCFRSRRLSQQWLGVSKTTMYQFQQSKPNLPVCYFPHHLSISPPPASYLLIVTSQANVGPAQVF